MTNSLKHIAIIPDGSARWAVKHNKPRHIGHKRAYEILKEITFLCAEKKIQFLTIYAMSGDNFSRAETEIRFVMALVKECFSRDLHEYKDKNIVLNPFGNYMALQLENLKETLINAKNETKNNTGLVVNVGINYLGTDDILQSIYKSYKQHNNTLPENMKELGNEIYKNSYLAGAPPIDFCIRPGGEIRLSNLSLWHLAYAEFYFTKTLWPDFSAKKFNTILEKFYLRERRFGREKAPDDNDISEITKSK